MKFLSMYESKEKNTSPSQEEMARMGQLIEKFRRAGGRGGVPV